MGTTQIMGSAAGEPAPTGEQPQAFGKYKVLSLLGAGGFGAVWRCMDEALGREVAVKSLAATYRDDADVRGRFLREARALARVSHASVVQVFDVGECEHGPYFVMELVAGRDLGALLKSSGALEEGRCLRLAREAMSGLAAAYNAGVVHRDVKPGNFMVTGEGADEHLKVTDFGLAFPTAEAGSRMTSASVVLGTPEYMAPEQARGEAVDARADMYALGCTLYEALTGRVPFAGDSPQATVALHFTTTPEPPRVWRPQLSGPTQSFVLRLMARDPAGRFATWQEALAALDGATLQAPHTGVHAGPGSIAIAGGPPSGPQPAVAPGQTARVEGAPVITENLALCFVDLLDFQERTRQQTRDENTEWVGQFGDGMKRLVRQRGGRFIKQVYGTVLCTFVSPTDAVLFGMAAVDAAWEWSRGKPPVMTWGLRVGINLGEVRLERGDVFGDPVNVAARVMSKADPAQVWFSDAVYLAMNRSEVESEGMGAHDLKGVPVPVRLFRALPAKGHVTGPEHPPFGVRVSARTTTESGSALEAVDRGAARLASTVNAAAGRARERALPALQSAGAGLRAAWDRIPAKARPGVLAGAAVVLVVGGGLVMNRLTDPYRKEKALLAEGRSGQVVRMLEERTSESPTAQWIYGKALVQAGQRAKGLEQWQEALEKDRDLANDETLEVLLDALETRDGLARKLIVKHWGKRASGRLEDLVLSDRYQVRHNAADALKEMKLGDDVEWVGLYLKDIRTESECSRRVAAVRALEKLGGEDALEAVVAARAEPGGDGRCVADALAGAERRLRAGPEQK